MLIRIFKHAHHHLVGSKVVDVGAEACRLDRHQHLKQPQIGQKVSLEFLCVNWLKCLENLTFINPKSSLHFSYKAIMYRKNFDCVIHHLFRNLDSRTRPLNYSFDVHPGHEKTKQT